MLTLNVSMFYMINFSHHAWFRGLTYHVRYRRCCFLCRDLKINKKIISSIHPIFTVYESFCLHPVNLAAASGLSDQVCPLMEAFGKKKCLTQTSMWALTLRTETVVFVNTTLNSNCILSLRRPHLIPQTQTDKSWNSQESLFLCLSLMGLSCLWVQRLEPH